MTPALPLRRAVAVVLLCSGCFRYVPLTPGTAADEIVEVTLSPDGVRAAAPILGNDVSIARGRLVRATADSVELRIDDLTTVDGRNFFVQGLRATLALSDASSVRVRELDRRRSTIAAIASFVAVSAFITGLRLAGGGEDGTGGGGTTPTVRLPVP